MGISYAPGKYNHAAGTRNAFAALSADLEAEGHPAMRVNDGDRELQDEIEMFLSRFRPQASGVGSFNDVRWWQGVRYVRFSPLGTVAPPGTGNHGKRRANDLGYPYNSDTPAHRRAQVLAKRHNITCEGMGFREWWHWTFWGPLGAIGNTGAAAGDTTTTPAPPTPALIEEEAMYFYVQIQGKLTTWILWVPGRGKYQTTQSETQAKKWRALVGKDARILTDPEVAEFINVAGLFKG